jgi:hypothetical protein
VEGGRRRSGYLATVAAVGLGSGAAGVIGLFLGLVVGLVFISVVAVVLFDGSPTDSQTETLVNLVPVVVGVPTIATCTALATYFLVERREEPTWTAPAVYASGRTTVWATAALNAGAFGVIAVVGRDVLFTLLFRPWLWPLYVFPVGLLARFIALRMPVPAGRSGQSTGS